MKKDTRDNNQYFFAESIGQYVAEYADRLNWALTKVDKEALLEAYQELSVNAQAGAQIYVAGNGGSAAICDHLNCDFEKGCFFEGWGTILVKNLAGSSAMITAIGNDIGFDEIFSKRLEYDKDIASNDIIILISSSGNSPNIVKAAEKARDLNMIVIGMTGFDGGKLKALSDISLHVPVNNYGVVEDAHQALMHCLAQFVYLKARDAIVPPAAEHQ